MMKYIREYAIEDTREKVMGLLSNLKTLQYAHKYDNIEEISNEFVDIVRNVFTPSMKGSATSGIDFELSDKGTYIVSSVDSPIERVKLELFHTKTLVFLKKYEEADQQIQMCLNIIKKVFNDKPNNENVDLCRQIVDLSVDLEVNYLIILIITF